MSKNIFSMRGRDCLKDAKRILIVTEVLISNFYCAKCLTHKAISNSIISRSYEINPKHTIRFIDNHTKAEWKETYPNFFISFFLCFFTQFLVVLFHESTNLAIGSLPCVILFCPDEGLCSAVALPVSIEGTNNLWANTVWLIKRTCISIFIMNSQSFRSWQYIQNKTYLTYISMNGLLHMQSTLRVLNSFYIWLIKLQYKTGWCFLRAQDIDFCREDNCV